MIIDHFHDLQWLQWIVIRVVILVHQAIIMDHIVNPSKPTIMKVLSIKPILEQKASNIKKQ